jgi:hypothetical protein
MGHGPGHRPGPTLFYDFRHLTWPARSHYHKGMKKWKIDRIISIATLVTSLIAIYLVAKKPRPVAAPQTPAAAAANAQSFQEKLQQLDQPKEPEAPPAEVHITSNEVSAAMAQAAGAIPAAASQQLGPTTDIGSMPNILDQQVSFDGDQVHGQFLTNIAGKDVWVTVSGHLGSKDGYATFDPTEFKIGDMSVPVSLVNDALQKKMSEQRDRMKLPDSVGGMKVENGELVLTHK